MFVGWVDPGWATGAHQSCSVTALLSWTKESKHDKRPVGQDEDRDRLTNYCDSQNRLNLGTLDKFGVIWNKTIIFKHLPPSPPTPFFLGSTSVAVFFTSSSPVAQGMFQRDREWGLWSLHHTLSLPLLPPQKENSSHFADSSPAPKGSLAQETVCQELLQCDSFV